MNTDDLEALLDGAEETDRLEFKGPMSWNKNSIVKDILALSNVQDGGYIIFGVEDVTLNRLGLDAAQLASFNFDEMRDQVSPYAEPRVIFRLFKPTDREGRKFAVIEVLPFEEIPVICSRDGADVQRGTIYFRSKSRRPASARVSSESDLRDIIESSIARRMQRLSRLGFLVNASTGEQYDLELGGL